MAAEKQAPKVTRYPTDDARRKLGRVVNDVANGRKRVVLTRHGMDVVAVVSMADLQKLEGAA